MTPRALIGPKSSQIWKDVMFREGVLNLVFLYQSDLRSRHVQRKPPCQKLRSATLACALLQPMEQAGKHEVPISSVAEAWATARMGVERGKEKGLCGYGDGDFSKFRQKQKKEGNVQIDRQMEEGDGGKNWVVENGAGKGLGRSKSRIIKG